MKFVKDLLGSKGSVWSVSPDTPVREVLKLFNEKNIGAVPVLSADETIAGIFSERDYARAGARDDKLCLDCPVADVMTTKVICIDPDRTIDDCMALMTDKRIRHLPVLKDGKMAGIVSIGDVVKATLADKDILIDQLEHYIEGSM